MSTAATLRHRLRSTLETTGFRWAATYAATRFAIALYASPRTFPTSWRFRWHGSATTEPYGVSALYSVGNTPTGRVFVQTLIGVICWVWMFREVLGALGRGNSFSKVTVGFLAIASLSAPVVVWDRTLLPESLKLSLFASIVAAWMMMQRRRGDSVAQRAGVGVIAAAALTSSVVFFLVAIPVALATAKKWPRTWGDWGPSWAKSGRGVSVLIGTLGLLSVLAIWPSTIRSGPVGSSAIADRAMNIVGERVLPDPYLRRRLQGAGLPKNLDPSLFRPRRGSADDYLLFRNTPLRSFAQSFPVISYVGAIVARPGGLMRTSIGALEGSVLTRSADVGIDGDELVARGVSNNVWGWSAPVHLGLLFVAIVSTVSLRASNRRGPKLFVKGTISASVLATFGAGILVWTNGADINRELLTFLVVSRLSLIVGLATLVMIWVRTSVEVDENGFRLLRIAKNPPVRAQIASFGRNAIIGVVALIALGSIIASIVSIASSDKGPVVKAPSASASLVKTVESQLRSRNVVVSPRVHRMLKAILHPWEARDDLKASLSNPDGTPNIEGVTLWARTFPDSSTESFAEHLGAIDELRSRLGLLAPDTGIIPVLYWTLKNEPTLNRDYSNVIGHLADFWNTHPEAQRELMANGRVDVLGLLKAANSVRDTDPTALNVQFDFFPVRQAIEALEDKK
jgi:hypothetical protein